MYVYANVACIYRVAMEELKEELYRGEEEEKTLRAELKDIVGVVKSTIIYHDLLCIKHVYYI